MTIIQSESDRIFKSWGTVEVRDTDGDFIPISEMEPIMHTMMKRGANIIDGHSNRAVGKILNWEIKNKQVGDKEVPGILLTGQIYKDYITDDEVWEDIKTQKSLGMSFGGKARQQDFVMMDGLPTRVLKNLEGYEFTVVRPGFRPVNQESEHVAANMVAKHKEDGVVVFAKMCAMMVEKGEKYDECVEQVKKDPDLEPKEGRTKEEAAHAICTESVGKSEEIMKYWNDMNREEQLNLIEKAWNEMAEVQKMTILAKSCKKPEKEIR